MESIGEHGRPDHDIRRLVEDLVEDGMIDGSMGFAEGYPHSIRLSSSGRLEVERWLASDEPTPHLPLTPSVVFNNYGDLHGSALVVGSPNSTASSSYSVEGADLAEFVRRFRHEVLDQLALSDEAYEAAQADLDTLEGESDSGAIEPRQARPALRRLLNWAGAPAVAGASTVGREEVVALGHDALQALGT